MREGERTREEQVRQSLDNFFCKVGEGKATLWDHPAGLESIRRCSGISLVF